MRRQCKTTAPGTDIQGVERLLAVRKAVLARRAYAVAFTVSLILGFIATAILDKYLVWVVTLTVLVATTFGRLYVKALSRVRLFARNRSEERRELDALDEESHRQLTAVLELLSAEKQLRKQRRKTVKGIERLNSAKGDVVFSGESRPGVALIIYERWISAVGAADASLEGAVASFVDNTRVDHVVTGSRSIGIGHSAGRGQASTRKGVNWGPDSSQSLVTTGNLNTNSISAGFTKNIVDERISGSAVVHVQGPHLDCFITFSDPHFAAQVANQINLAGKAFAVWAAERHDLVKQLNELLDEIKERQIEVAGIRSGFVDNLPPITPEMRNLILEKLEAGASGSKS